MRKDAIELKILLIKARVKQSEIAEKAGVSQAAVSRVVNGKLKSKHIEDIIHEFLEKAG